MEKCNCCNEVTDIEDLCPVCLADYENHILRVYLDRDEFTIEDEYLKRQEA